MKQKGVVRKLYLLMFIAFSSNSNAQWVGMYVGIGAPNYPVIGAVSPSVCWGWSPAHVVRTINGGASWENHPFITAIDAGASNICALNADTAWVAYYDFANIPHGKIMRTNNGGVSWEWQDTSAFRDVNSFLDFVYFWNSNDGVAFGDPAGGYFEIYVTNDGGNNWIRVNSSNIPAPLGSDEYGWSNSFSVVGNTIWCGTTRGSGFGNFGARTLKSYDKGHSWISSNTQHDGPIQSIAFQDSLNGIASNSLNSILRTSDGGITWSNISSTITPDHICYVPGSNSTFFADNYPASYSLDNGNSWIAASTFNVYDVTFINDSLGWAGGSQPNSDTIYKWSKPVSFLTGIQKSDDRLDDLIYPNPTHNAFTIESKLQNAELKIYDLTGREVFTTILISNHQTLNPNLSSGVYFVKVTDGEKVFTQKLIIQ